MSQQAKLALAVLAGAVVIITLMMLLRSEPEEKERLAVDPLVQAIPLRPSSEPLQVLGSGTVQPREEVSVGAEVSGKLVYVNPAFREGGVVRKGTVLFRIDPAEYRNRVRSAQADVAAQNVAVLQASEEVDIAREELRRFADRENQRDLLAEAIDENDYAARILPPRGASTGADKSSKGPAGEPAGKPARLATREPQLRSARAARERASAQLADAQLALNRTSVRAPFSGLVRSESASVGTLVQPGQALGSIVSTGAYEVRVSLTEDEAALIPDLLKSSRSRPPASIFFDYGGQTYRWQAYVDRADAILDAETRTIDVFLRVPDPLGGGRLVTGQAEGGSAGDAPPLLLGSFVRAEILGSSSAPFAAIPTRYLRPGNQIWVVRDGKLRILPVRVIQRTDRFAYISTPTLGEGGQLVTSALRAPIEGMKVRVEKPAAAGSKAKPKLDASEAASDG